MLRKEKVSIPISKIERFIRQRIGTGTNIQYFDKAGKIKQEGCFTSFAMTIVANIN
jgi:hypothetical protein